MSNDPSTQSEKCIDSEVVRRRSSDEETTIDHVPCGDDFKGAYQDQLSSDDEYPDGGLRAWLIVFGVHSIYPSLCASRTD